MQDLITFAGIDVIGLSETWLNQNISDHEVSLPGYRLFRLDRKVKSPCGSGDPDSGSMAAHGGVCIFVKDHLSALPVNLNVDPNLEFITIRLCSTRNLPSYTIACLYRPPSASTSFWYSLQYALEQLESSVGCDNLVVMGDFNVDMLAKVNSQKRLLLNLMSSFNFKNTVDSATRTTDRSQSCIDLILTNSATHQKTSVKECALSDHDLVVSFFGNTIFKKRTSTMVARRDFRNLSMDTFKEVLTQKSLPKLFWETDSIDDVWSIWISTIYSAVNIVAPVKRRCPRRRSCPFMIPQLLNLIHERKRLYRILHKPEADRAALFPVYRRLRSETNNMYRQLRNSYYQKCCKEYSQDPKQLWNVIRSLSGRSKPRLCLLASPSSLNSFFGELVSDQSVSHDVPFGPAAESDLTDFQEVSASQVESLLECLDVTKAPGSDEIHPSLLQGCADIFAPSLTWLFNKSLRSGVVPRGFKEANIVPLLKSSKADATDPSSYRGISLLPVISKLLEKIVEGQLVSYFDKKRTLSEYQFGFRHGRSTEDLMAKAVSDWSSNTDNGLSTVVAFIDLSKAFDKVLHQAMLFTLQQAGVGGAVLRWFASYLSDRQQRICVNAEKCPYQAVQRGVPQGSILGPLLFNLCLASLPALVTKNTPSSILLLFADDKTLYASNKSPHEAADKVSQALSTICDTIREKGLAVNLKKTVFMVLGPPSVVAASANVNVICDDCTLEQVSAHRCLGVLVDNRLSWSDHVSTIASKVSQRIGCLKRIWRQLSPKARCLYFLSVVQPCLEYCSVVMYTSISQKDRERLLSLHRRGIRIVCGASPREDISPLLKDLQLRKLETRWLIHLLSFAFRCLSLESASAPICIRELFTTPGGYLQRYTTRGLISGSVTVPQRKSKCGRNCFDNRVPIIWNNLPAELRSTSSLSVFKKKLLLLLSDRAACDHFLKLAFCPPSDL